jgi:antitoxin ParD1/3/4
VRIARLVNFTNLCYSVCMPTRSISLTAQLEREVLERVKSGKYENASEVVRAGLRALSEREREDREKLRWLRKAIDEGDRSGIAHDFSFERIKQRAGIRARRARKAR